MRMSITVKDTVLASFQKSLLRGIAPWCVSYIIAHIFLCGYTYDAIAFPTEVWHGTHNGKPHLRFLKKLATANDVHTLLVSVDSESSITASSYILDPQQYDVNREGTFLFASWAAPD